MKGRVSAIEKNGKGDVLSKYVLSTADPQSKMNTFQVKVKIAFDE